MANRIPPGQLRSNGGFADRRACQATIFLGSSPLSDLWNGDWGIFRVENGRQADLAVLAWDATAAGRICTWTSRKGINASKPIPKVDANLTQNNNPCPSGSPVKLYNITAIRKPMTYNDNFNETDPLGLMYVLAEEKAAVLSGAKPTEPLVIRANQGDCIRVNLTNDLPDLTALASATNMIFPDGMLSTTSLDPRTLQHFGDAQMSAIVVGLPANPQFVLAKWPIVKPHKPASAPC